MTNNFATKSIMHFFLSDFVKKKGVNIV